VKNEFFLYDLEKLSALLSAIIKQNIDINIYSWLEEKAGLIKSEDNAAQLNLLFTAISRKSGKKIINLNDDQRKQIGSAFPGFYIDDWPLPKLCRVWILMQVNAAKEDIYCNKIESLFKNAEMNELAALYAALPVFAYPKKWVNRCIEGIRSNIGIVLEAIMYNNPYPSKFLDQRAWNQLVLKAFFTDKDVNSIIGLDDRANLQLALTLIDYAHERWAAKRPVNTQLWRLVGKFINETNFSDIQNLFTSGNVNERKAAALACSQSEYGLAQILLDTAPELKDAIKENKLNWMNLNS
jgi:muconolactone delta-isomerase